MDFRFTRQDCLWGLLIVVLAFAVRLIVISDRAASPLISGFDPIPAGSDQSVYYASIAAYHAGQFPPATYFFQPGMPWLLIIESALLRTDNPGALRIPIAWLAALNCGLLVATVRLAFGRRSVAYLAGLLLALYLVGIFYDTDFVITAQATQLVGLLLFGACWLWRAERGKPGGWVGTALIGLSGGLLMLFRGELVALVPVIGLWLIFIHRDRLILGQLALAAVVLGIVIAPTVLHNRAGGADYLITPVGSAEIYRGNNRDADGTYGTSIATQTTSGDYFGDLGRDIGLSPLRFIELELHKIGLYISAGEPGNNLSYVQSGKNVSPFLQADPLNFSILIGLALFGIWAAWRDQARQAAALFGAAMLTMAGTTLLIWVEARIRTPVIVVLTPLAAHGIVFIADCAKSASRRVATDRHNALRSIRAAIIVAIAVGIAMYAGQWTEYRLPTPVIVSALPTSAETLDAIFDNTLELVGWQVEGQYSSFGTIEPFHPYVLSIYWRLKQPATTDYSFAVSYYLNGKRLMGVDKPIGTVSYPATPTSLWQPGNIHVEHVAFNWRQFAVPLPTSGDIFLSVYPNRDAQNLLKADNLTDHSSTFSLARPAIAILPGGLPDDWPRNQVPVSFGDQLLLISRRIPLEQHAAPGQPLKFDLGWQTGKNPIRSSYTFGLYALNGSDHIAAQTDTLLNGGRLLTSSLPPDYTLPDTMSLTAPATPGTYKIALVIYDSITHDRLQVPNTVNGLYSLGTLTVRETDQNP